ncbi:MAG TPA: arylsulfotransferase family protein [Gaiellaceae bacterium]|nr:arylsulfotransferase family protein [Gaiellaceae bacterium]
MSTRREFLVAAAGGTAALALPRFARALPAAAGEAKFVTQPTFRVPTIDVLTRAYPAPGYLFVATLNGPGQRGPCILDDHGNVVWFKPLDKTAIDFRVQQYGGKPVLTWWEGQISQLGVGQGEGVILDQTYTEIARVRAGNGLQADVHELLLTPKGTALVTIYNSVQRDLTAVGGPASHNTWDSIIQEIDIKTGNVLFEWHSLDHVPITDSYAPVLDPYDYFHINSIEVDYDGNLIVSARNTSAIYKIDKSTGNVMWVLGGRSSTIQMGPRVFFMYQHDARVHPDGTLTLFDDGPGPSSQAARAIRLGVDTVGRSAVLLQEYVHKDPLMVAAMGNAQQLAGDAMLVGWGTQPYMTEFGPLGDVRFDAKFTGDAWNYRTFRNPWVGTPKAKPAVVVKKHVGKSTVYASWNGSTQTAYWRIDGKTFPRNGFETVMSVPGHPASVTALDKHHRPLSGGSTRV